jgi:hypothetical protein
MNGVIAIGPQSKEVEKTAAEEPLSPAQQALYRMIMRSLQTKVPVGIAS